MSGYDVVKHEGKWAVKYYDEIGKRHYKRLFTKAGDPAPSRQTKKMAEQKAATWFSESGPVPVVERGITVKALFAIFHKGPGMPRGGKTTLSPESVERRAEILLKFEKYLSGTIGITPEDSATKITPTVVNGFLDLRAKTLKPNSLRRELAVLRRGFNYAIEIDALKDNPVKRRISQTSRAAQEKEVRDKAWTEEEYLKLRNIPKKQWVDLLLVICWEAGLRPGEAMALRSSDFDHEAKVINVEQGKTGSRTVPLSLRLSDYVADLNVGAILGPVTPNAKSQAIKKLIKKAGITQTLYGARHAFCLRLAKSGLPVHALRKIMGHSSIMTTQIYLDAVDETDINDARNILDR